MLDILINKFSLHGNWVDLIFILTLIYFILTAHGFIDTIMDVAAFLMAIFFSYKSYAFFGNLILTYFSMPHGLANATGFFIAWFLSETILFFIITKISRHILYKTEHHPLNIIFGYLGGVLKTFVIFLFCISLVFSLPVRGQIKEAILESFTGP